MYMNTVDKLMDQLEKIGVFKDGYDREKVRDMMQDYGDVEYEDGYNRAEYNQAVGY